MQHFQRASPAFAVFCLSTSVFAADLPAGQSSLGFSAEVASEVQRRTEDAFAALGYSPMPTKAPRLRQSDMTAPLPSNSVMVFAGQYAINNLGDTVNPFTATHENQGIVAGGYGHDFYRLSYGFVMGMEIGAGVKSGLGTAGELWGGINIRNTGFVLFDAVRIGAGITVGLSAVTKATGIEAQREIKDHGNATLLAYLGPELTVALVSNPNWEAFYRVQHRSGAYGLIANFIEGANANVFGVRYRF
jgi:hypothetical protein